MSKSILRRCLLASAGLSVLVTAPAFAATEGDVLQIEELVVTARKREETLKDVPIAVSAFTTQAMENRQIQDINDIAQFTPGLQSQESFGRSADRPVIRGASNILVSDGKVGVFIDGIPYYGEFGALDLENAQRVEVIKGPQSAVFGRGTLTGAVNIVSRRPSDEFEGRIKATVGSYGRLELGGAASGPITSWMSGEVGFKAYSFDGQYDNLAMPGTTLGAEKSGQLTGALFFKPTEDFSASIRYLRTQDSDGLYPIALQPSTANNCFLATRPYFCGEVPSPKSFALNTDKLLNPGARREADRFFGSMDWDVLGSGYTLSYQAGVSEVYRSTGTDQSYDGREFFLFGASCPFIPIGNQDCSRSAFNTTDAARRNSWTNEVRLSSPGDQPIRWRVGFYQGLDRNKPLAKYLEATESGLDMLGDQTRVKNTAFFGGVDWDIVSGLTLGVELRHQKDDVAAETLAYRADQYFAREYLLSLRGGNPAQIIGAANTRQQTFKATLPRVTLNWKMNPDVSFYAQYAEGNSPGGFNQADAPQSSYDEESLKNYEIGAKTSIWGFDYLNLSLFFNDYSGQVLTNTYVGASTGVVNSYKANIGTTEVKGLELEGARRLPAGFTAQFAYTYLDAEITEGIEPEQAILLMGRACKTGTTTNLALPGCLDAASVAGNAPPLVSKHAGSFSLRYDATISGDWDAFANADLIYRSSYYDQVMNLAETGDSTKVNLQVGVRNTSGLRLSLWGKNVFNEDAPEGILRYLDLGAGVPKAPSGDTARAFAITPPRKAEWGVTVSKTF